MPLDARPNLAIIAISLAASASHFANAAANEGIAVATTSGEQVPQKTSTATELGGSALLPCLRQAPPYPSAALRAGEEGKSMIGFVVLEDGSVRDRAIQQSSGSARLDAAAMAHFERCLTVIGEHADTGLKSGRYVLPIHFRLE